MTVEQIIANIQQRFGSAVTAEPGGLHPHVVVQPGSWIELARFLRDDPSLRFDLLCCVTAIDYPGENRLVSAYDLLSTVHRHAVAVKVYAAGRDNPHVPSVASIWPAAEWHEREAFDLMGILYDGHPNLVRILLPEDWPGHPLRKDYVFPKEYGGIPCSVETANTSNEP